MANASRRSRWCSRWPSLARTDSARNAHTARQRSPPAPPAHAVNRQDDLPLALAHVLAASALQPA
eukprot:2812521-Prymnesium_polylepis.1